MKINLSELQYKCLSRGELPGCCKGCPANVDDSISDNSSNGILARCTLLCPRAWDVTKIETAAQKLLFGEHKDVPAPKCYKCRHSMFDGFYLRCTFTTTDTDFSTVLLEYSCNSFEPSEGYRLEFE